MKLESVMMYHAPCGCSILYATAETRVPSNRPGEQHRDTHPKGKERVHRHVTWQEAERIRLTKLHHEFWGSRTNPNPNPEPKHCLQHAHLGHTEAWYQALQGPQV